MISREIRYLLQRAKSTCHLLQLRCVFVKAAFDHDDYLVSLLVSSSCSISIPLARLLFDSLPISPPLFAWNWLIRSYTQSSIPIESVKLFSGMVKGGIKPDNFTYPFVLKACGQASMIHNGEATHSMIAKTGLDSDKYVLNTLLRMYCAFGEIDLAKRVFDEMTMRDVVSWSSMIAGYVACGRPSDAFRVFHDMKFGNQKPNSVTLVSLLSASTRLLSISAGKSIHSYIIVNNMDLDASLGTVLLEMYSRCGSIEEALKVFETMNEKNLQAWTVMISALADNNRASDAISLFNQMEQSGLKPDSVSFSGILSACAHSGLVDEGKMFFDRMITVYEIRPTVEHYGCMVDLFGRAGLVEEAYGIIKNMPMEPNAVILRSFLGSCRNYAWVSCFDNNLRNLLKLEPELGANYILAASVSSLSGSWDDAADLRITMKQKGLTKAPGRSWLD